MIAKKVLHVEDEALLALFWKKKLESYGYNIIHTFSGEDAISTLKKGNRPDIVLMDINLGSGLDGTEAAEIILKEWDIPLLFLSSHSDRDTVDRTEKISSYGYVVKSSDIAVLDASIKMALKLFHANRTIKREKQLLGATLSSIADAVITTDLHAKIMFMNPAAEQLTGYKGDSIYGKDIMEVFSFKYATSGKLRKNPFEDVLGDGKTCKAANNTILQIADGKELYISWSASPIVDDNNEIEGSIFVFQDISEKYRLQNMIEEQKKRLVLLFDHATHWIMEIDRNDKILFMNKPFAEILKKEPRKIAGKTICEVFPKEIAKIILKAKEEVMEKEIPETCTRSLNIDDKEIWLETSFQPVFSNGNEIVSILSVSDDITNLKNQEVSMLSRIEQDEISFRELNHRMVNNLLMINSYLHLKQSETNDNKEITVLHNVSGYIGSMIELNKLITSKDSVQTLSVENYLSKLIINFERILPEGRNISIIKEIDDFQLSYHLLCDLSIIINELVTNSLKYAFDANMAQPIIRISMKKTSKGFDIAYSDNGKGFPSRGEDSGKGFGITMIEEIIRQMGGRITIESDKGTIYRFSFEI